MLITVNLKSSLKRTISVYALEMTAMKLDSTAMSSKIVTPECIGDFLSIFLAVVYCTDED